MKVTYQDCGCIALPDEIVAALGLSAGSILKLVYDAESKVLSLTSEGETGDGIGVVAGASCRIRAEIK